jgi:16S rRNA (guanine527-N7)-methyltransferase
VLRAARICTAALEAMADWTPEDVGARFNVSRESLDRLGDFVALLLRWRSRINLIGASTVSRVWQRHVADSLQLQPLLPQSSHAILDLGSGAGFPGLVLAIATGREAHLIESSGKKAAFLREAVRTTGALAVIHEQRIETVSRAMLPRISAVTARAVAPLSLLLRHAEPWLTAGARAYFHKGQHVDEELTESAKYWRITYCKHPSLTEPMSVILEVAEILRA